MKKFLWFIVCLLAFFATAGIHPEKPGWSDNNLVDTQNLGTYRLGTAEIDTYVALFCKGLGSKSGNTHPSWPDVQGGAVAVLDSQYKYCNINKEVPDSSFFTDRVLYRVKGFNNTDNAWTGFAQTRMPAFRWAGLNRLPSNCTILSARICWFCVSGSDFSASTSNGLCAFLDTTTAAHNRWWNYKQFADAGADTNQCGASWNQCSRPENIDWPQDLADRGDHHDWGIPNRTRSLSGENWTSNSVGYFIDVTDLVQLYVNNSQLPRNAAFWINGYHQSNALVNMRTGTESSGRQPFLVVTYSTAVHKQPWYRNKALSVSFIVDDNDTANWYDGAWNHSYKAMMDSHSYKYSLGVMPSNIGTSETKMDSSEINYMYQQGHEILQHDYYHSNYITIASPDSMAEAVRRYDFANALGIPVSSVRGFAYGWGYCDTHYVRALIDSNYIYARSLSYGDLEPDWSSMDPPQYLKWGPIIDYMTTADTSDGTSSADTVCLYNICRIIGISSIFGSMPTGNNKATMREKFEDVANSAWHNNTPIWLLWHSQSNDVPSWQHVSWLLEFTEECNRGLWSVATAWQMVNHYINKHDWCPSPDGAAFEATAEQQVYMCPSE